VKKPVHEAELAWETFATGTKDEVRFKVKAMISAPLSSKMPDANVPSGSRVTSAVAGQRERAKARAQSS
jgi:hypothetical protein